MTNAEAAALYGVSYSPDYTGTRNNYVTDSPENPWVAPVGSGTGTKSSGTALSSLVNGDTLTGLGNLFSAFTGKGGTTNVVNPTPAATSGSSMWLIVGGVLVLAVVGYFLLKKK